MVPLADLHIHLLPQVDDGPKDWETTEEMLRILSENEVKIVAPTPHVYEQDWHGIESKHQGLPELERRAGNYGIRVHSAAEIWAIPDLPERWEKLIPLTYAGNGKYALIEFDVLEMPIFAEWLLFQLKVRGVTPIIAHPERYLWLQEDERNLYRLLAAGALLQVSADTFLRAEAQVGKTAQWLIKNGLADFIASDWHSPDMPYPLAQAVQKLMGELTESQLERLVWRVPSKIVSGQTIQPSWQSSNLRLDIQAFISGFERKSQKRKWWEFWKFFRKR
ncbi:MAG: hypothetical protein NZ805_03070 [Armatimonadetes bacterium]|nr:hypothetical protein [Armatimonadota bacterium]MDW8027867.1 CpsB/CapC family capsule biosynthesis tyrosine phosphatase [Armatimonadota bacterium]